MRVSNSGLAKSALALLLMVGVAAERGNCIPTVVGPECPDGEVWSDLQEVCVPGCNLDSTCPEGWTCVDVACEGGGACRDQCLPPGGECLTGLDCAGLDANYCEGDWTCEEYACVWVPGPPPVCADGLWCNGLETCDPATGGCMPGVPPCGDRLCDEEGDTCPPLPEECVDFEDLALNAEFFYGDVFVDSGVTMIVEEFYYLPSGSTTGGVVRVEGAEDAGGSGLDVMVSNVNVEFDFGGPVGGLTLVWGEYGGNINLMVNGDLRNVEDFIELDGLDVGGAKVDVVENGDGTGALEVDGLLSTFVIGGQELWIDDVCPWVECEVDTDCDEGLFCNGVETCVANECVPGTPPCPPDWVCDEGLDECFPVGSECVDFEDLADGTEYAVGDTFTDSGVTVTVAEFFWLPSGSTAEGYAWVSAGGQAGGSGLEVYPMNANLDFDLGGTWSGLQMKFGDSGGNKNLEVNGEFRNVDSLMELDGQVVGGVLVLVQDDGGQLGTLTLAGPVSSFMIGGQEMFIDDVCPWVECEVDTDCDDGLFCNGVETCVANECVPGTPPCPPDWVCDEGLDECFPVGSECVDFEDLADGTEYAVGDTFTDSGVTVTVAEFFWLPSGSTAEGYAWVSAGGQAGGSGLEVYPMNANLDFDLGGTWSGLQMKFGDSGGNKNLEVNGEFRNVDSLMELDGQVVGGVLVLVQDDGGQLGTLTLAGPVSSFMIGGQEMFIDDVCPLPPE